MPQRDLIEADLKHYVDSPEARERVYRRSLIVVVLSQIFGGAGLAAGVTVGALLAQDMLDAEGLAGLPAALFTLGSALAAFMVGRRSQRAGRRRGLATGFFAGAIGAAGVVAAAVLDSPILLFVALFVYGAGSATNLQARYAGTDLASPNRRGTAVSIAMVSTTFGAVAGPNSVGMTGDLATSWGIPALAGPFALAAVAYAVAGLMIFLFLRPDPYLVATFVSRSEVLPEPAAELSSKAVHSINRGVMLGAAVMVLTQIAMAAIMTMTPVHMRHHGHSLGDVGFVIGVHIGAMYFPSLVTGRLVDTVGRLAMAIASGVTLLAAGIVAAAAPADSMLFLTVALALLGIGWNFGLISGTALIVDSTPLVTRAKTQGSVDVLVALAGATGGVMSGMVVAASSYATLALAGGFLALLLVPVVSWSRHDVRAVRDKVANSR
ncbi:MFS transporter [soil metagenome]